MTENNPSGSAVNAEESISRAARLIQTGEFSQAIEFLTPVVSAAPTRQALTMLAECYHRLDEHAEAATIRDLSCLIDASQPASCESHLRVLPSAS